MTEMNKIETNDKLLHGLLRLSTMLEWISGMVLDGDEQEWILQTVDEALDDAVELYLLARRAKAK